MPAELDYFEVAAFDGGEGGVEDVVVPAGVVGAAHVEIAAVVGDDQSVGFHRLENAAQRVGIRGDVLRRFQAQARAHREGAARGSGAMGRGKNVAVRVPHGDAEGVTNGDTAVHLVVANQSR